MKQLYTFAFLFILLAGPIVDAYAQKITLTFDPSTNEFNAGFWNEYKKIKRDNYYYEFTNVNTALHSIKSKPTYVRKITTLPDVLKTLIPLGTASEQSRNLKFKPFIAPNTLLDTDPITKEMKRLQEEFGKLKYIVERSGSAYEVLEKKWLDIPACVSEATTALNEISVKFGQPLPSDSTGLRAAVENTIQDFASKSGFMQSYLQNQYKTALATPDIPNELIRQLTTISAQHEYVTKEKEEIYAALALLYAMKRSSNTIRTKEYGIKGDYTRLNILMYKNNFLSKPDTVVQQEVLTYRKHYIKVDFTSGFFYNELTPSVFYVDTADKKIAQQKTPRRDFAVGGMAHLKYAVFSWAKVAGSAGAAVSPLDGKVKLLVGGSLFLFRRDEFALSYGAAFAKLPTLPGGYNVGQELPSYVSSVPTYDKWQRTFFIGVSYSLLNN